MSENRKYILAIDMGTSGPKVALVSVRGEVAASEFEPTPLLLLPNGGAEQRPDDWWNAITAAARRLLGRGLVPAGDVAAVSCTTQWAGTVAVDRDGNPLMNAINWMDTRGAPHIKWLTGGQIEIEGYRVDKLWRWMQLTGGAPGHSGKDSIAHILYLKHERPEIYRAAYKFLEPMDYVNLRLTGQWAASFATITLHWLTDNRNIANVAYDDGLIKLCGVEREKLPDLKPTNAILGPLKKEVAADLGLPDGTPVVMATPDLHSAAIGSGAVRDCEPHLCIGTSSWLSCHVPFKKTDLFHNMASIPAGIPNRYLLANEHETSGVCLNFLRDNLIFPDDDLAVGAKPPDVYRKFDRMVEKTPPGSDKVIFTPWLYGERTPVEDHSVRGAFYNLSLKTTREHLVRAVFEGVALNSRWLLGYVEQFVGRKFEWINMIGGGASSNVWCQIHADALDRPIRQVQNPIEAGVRGAAWLAAMALGYAALDDIAEHTPIANVYQPDPAHRKLYDELFREFVNIYQSNKGIYARLNK